MKEVKDWTYNRSAGLAKINTPLGPTIELDVAADPLADVALFYRDVPRWYFAITWSRHLPYIGIQGYDLAGRQLPEENWFFSEHRAQELIDEAPDGDIEAAARHMLARATAA